MFRFACISPVRSPACQSSHGGATPLCVLTERTPCGIGQPDPHLSKAPAHGDQASARDEAHLPEQRLRSHYDLNRDPVVCPICGTTYQIASAPAGTVLPEEKPARKAKKEYAEEPVAAVAEVEGEEALEPVEGEEVIAPEADETFLEEEEEDGGDMSNIIGGPVSEDDETG